MREINAFGFMGWGFIIDQSRYLLQMSASHGSLFH